MEVNVFFLKIGSVISTVVFVDFILHASYSAILCGH